jgi:hypothetical protein
VDVGILRLVPVQLVDVEEGDLPRGEAGQVEGPHQLVGEHAVRLGRHHLRLGHLVGRGVVGRRRLELHDPVVVGAALQGCAVAAVQLEPATAAEGVDPGQRRLPAHRDEEA